MKITKGTIIRTILMVLVIVNMILKQTGHDVINVSESQIATILESLIEVGTVISCFWYNNSYSDKAKKADKFLKQLKESEE